MNGKVIKIVEALLLNTSCAMQKDSKMIVTSLILYYTNIMNEDWFQTFNSWAIGINLQLKKLFEQNSFHEI